MGRSSGCRKSSPGGSNRWRHRWQSLLAMTFLVIQKHSSLMVCSNSQTSVYIYHSVYRNHYICRNSPSYIQLHIRLGQSGLADGFVPVLLWIFISSIELTINFDFRLNPLTIWPDPGKEYNLNFSLSDTFILSC